MKQRTTMDMTQGPIWRQLLAFAIPLMLSDLAQSFYNTVDSIVVGRFCGTAALAAVGSTSSIVRTLVGFFTGLTVGCTVVVGHAFGKKDEQELHRAVHTIISLSLVLSVALTILGVLITDLMLRLLGTPPDVFPLARSYIRIYFSGLSGLVLYNAAASILRAVGDAKRPAQFLFVTSTLNILLDLVLVVGFSMGVEGVAYATILSQFVSAFLAMRALMTTTEAHRLDLKKLSMQPAVLTKVLKNGVPIGLQKLLTSFSNVVVISYLSAFGSSCLAGWAIFTKVHHINNALLQSVGAAETTFVSQNMGCKQYRRIRSGVASSFLIGFAVMGVLAPLIFLFAPYIAAAWNADEAVTEYAALFIRTIACFEAIHVCSPILSGALRGMGKATASTIAMLTGLIGGRQLYLFLITKVIYTPQIVSIGYPVGWLVAVILMAVQYLFFTRKWKRESLQQLPSISRA